MKWTEFLQPTAIAGDWLFNVYSITRLFVFVLHQSVREISTFDWTCLWSFCEVFNPSLCLSAGGDDRRVLLWHMEKAIHARSKPVKLKGEHLSNIFCLAFDSTNKKVFSGGKKEREKISIWSLLTFYVLIVARRPSPLLRPWALEMQVLLHDYQCGVWRSKVNLIKRRTKLLTLDVQQKQNNDDMTDAAGA